jgi:hypothetical protein
MKEKPMKSETIEVVDEHGVVHEHTVTAEPKRKGGKRQPPRPLTPEEEETKRERESYRRTKRQVLEGMCPALAVEGDRMNPIDDVIETTGARERNVLLRLPRASGLGWPGSALVVSRREYLGGVGGEARDYVLLFIEATDNSGRRFRAGRGVTLNFGDLRPVGEALIAAADALESEKP